MQARFKTASMLCACLQGKQQGNANKKYDCDDSHVHSLKLHRKLFGVGIAPASLQSRCWWRSTERKLGAALQRYKR
jgi:hypothetical protein